VGNAHSSNLYGASFLTICSFVIESNPIAPYSKSLEFSSLLKILTLRELAPFCQTAPRVFSSAIASEVRSVKNALLGAIAWSGHPTALHPLFL
jgi:hypothetical protein